MPDVQHHHVLVVIETDSTGHSALLNPGQAAQALSHLAADLGEIVPGIRNCALAMPGALFDQTEVLKPGLPVFDALESLQKGRMLGGGFQPGLMALGASDGKMPDQRLAPNADPAPLRLLPLLISAPAETLDDVSRDTERLFLDQGHVSAHTATGLAALFGIEITHARLMTLTDLMAMLRLQLEHVGFLPLWTLLDAVLRDADPGVVETERGHRFSINDGMVTARFETFDHWAGSGAGADVDSNPEALSEGYLAWTREYRQYQTTLAAHGVTVRATLPDETDASHRDAHVVEQALARPPRGAAPLTEHRTDDLGTVAVTVSDEHGLCHYYPLEAQGVDAIRALTRGAGAPDTAVARPGGLCIDPQARRLTADLLVDGPAQ